MTKVINGKTENIETTSKITDIEIKICKIKMIYAYYLLILVFQKVLINFF